MDCINISQPHKPIFLNNDFRSFVTWEQNFPVNPNIEHKMRQDLDDYKHKLVADSGPLPDPFTLTEGWLDETYKHNWPPVTFLDMGDYLRCSSGITPDLFCRVSKDYKQGKGYR